MDHGLQIFVLICFVLVCFFFVMRMVYNSKCNDCTMEVKHQPLFREIER